MDDHTVGGIGSSGRSGSIGSSSHDCFHQAQLGWPASPSPQLGYFPSDGQLHRQNHYQHPMLRPTSAITFTPKQNISHNKHLQPNQSFLGNHATAYPTTGAPFVPGNQSHIQQQTTGDFFHHPHSPKLHQFHQVHNQHILMSGGANFPNITSSNTPFHQPSMHMVR